MAFPFASNKFPSLSSLLEQFASSNDLNKAFLHDEQQESFKIFMYAYLGFKNYEEESDGNNLIGMLCTHQTVKWLIKKIYKISTSKKIGFMVCPQHATMTSVPYGDYYRHFIMIKKRCKIIKN